MNRVRRHNWGNQEHARPNHQIDTRIEHHIDFAHIIRSTRHRIAHWLKAMKGHAFANQAHIQFFANIALEQLAQPFGAEIASKLQH